MRLAIRGEYPDTWTEIARSVKEDAGYRCVRCHHPFTSAPSVPQSCDAACDPLRGAHMGRGLVTDAAGAVRTLKGINYGVHHFDGDKSNCRWWNLMALCNSCHLTIQATVIPDRPWLFEHSLWFRDYVCGFYAWYYAEREITRAEAQRDAGHWLALGQPWRSHVTDNGECDSGRFISPARLSGGAH